MIKNIYKENTFCFKFHSRKSFHTHKSLKTEIRPQLGELEAGSNLHNIRNEGACLCTVNVVSK